MNLIQNPFKVFLRYVLQQALKKFVKTPVQLTNEDFNKSSITLNDIQLNCQVSPKLAANNQL